MVQPVALSSMAAVAWVLTGIIVSLVLPVAVRTLRSARLEAIGDKPPTLSQRISAAWQKHGGNRYLGIALAAALVAVVVVFLLGMEFFKIRDAVLAGFAWESLISKLLGGKS